MGRTAGAVQLTPLMMRTFFVVVPSVFQNVRAVEAAVLVVPGSLDGTTPTAASCRWMTAKSTAAWGRRMNGPVVGRLNAEKLAAPALAAPPT